MTTEKIVPMRKQETIKEDGRLLIYYTFPAENGAEKADENTEARDV